MLAICLKVRLKKMKKYPLEGFFTVHMEKCKFFAISDNLTSTCCNSILPVLKSLYFSYIPRSFIQPIFQKLSIANFFNWQMKLPGKYFLNQFMG